MDVTLQRYAVSARIIGVNVGASKTKMFMTSVFWSDDNEVAVYRSFRDFKKFHRTLKKRFPLSGGKRVIPKFRARARKANQKKKGLSKWMRHLRFLEVYCTELLTCDSTVTRCLEVRQFFMPKDHDLQDNYNSIVILRSDNLPEDDSGVWRREVEVGQPFVTQTYRCMAPYETKDTKNRPFKVALDEILQVLMKDPGGWWLAENYEKRMAWFPAPYLDMCEEEDGDCLDGIPLPGTWYYVVRNYITEERDELSVPFGSVVEVLRKSDDGWWLLRYKGKTGYVPSMYLQPYNNPHVSLHSVQTELHRSALNWETMDQSSILAPTLPRKVHSLETQPVPACLAQRELKNPDLSDIQKSSTSWDSRTSTSWDSRTNTSSDCRTNTSSDCRTNTSSDSRTSTSSPSSPCGTSSESDMSFVSVTSLGIDCLALSRVPSSSLLEKPENSRSQRRSSTLLEEHSLCPVVVNLSSSFSYKGSPATSRLSPRPQGTPPTPPTIMVARRPPRTLATPRLSPRPHGTPATPRLSPRPHGTPATPRLSPQPHCTPATPRLSPRPQGTPATPRLSPRPHGTPATPRLSPRPHGTPATPRFSPRPQGTADTSRSSPRPQDSFSTPQMPARPMVQEILTRCTTVTRKSALVGRARLFSQQQQILTR